MHLTLHSFWGFTKIYENLKSLQMELRNRHKTEEQSPAGNFHATAKHRVNKLSPEAELSEDEDEIIKPLYNTPENKKFLEDVKKANLDDPLNKLKESKSKEDKNESKNGHWLKTIGGFLAVAALIIAILHWNSNPENKVSTSQQIQNLRLYFPRQKNETWHSLLAGASDFKRDNTERPLVILMTGDKETQECLGRKFLEALDKRPDLMNAGRLQGEEYGETVQQMRTSLKDSGSLLLTNLEMLDARLATALHVVCDRESPLVKNSVVLMTSGRSLELMARSWSSHIEDDKLVALLARLRDRVVRVLPEDTLPCDL